MQEALVGSMQRVPQRPNRRHQDRKTLSRVDELKLCQVKLEMALRNQAPKMPKNYIHRFILNINFKIFMNEKLKYSTC